MSPHALAGVPVFAGLSQADLERLAASTSASVLADRAVAAIRGAPATSLLVVERGTLCAVHETADGRRVRLGYFDAPRAVDKVALLDSGTHTATWEAVGRTTVRRVPKQVVLSLIDDVAAVRRHVLAHLASEVRRHQEERVRTASADTGTRVAAWLVEQMASQGVRIVLPHGQEGLAEVVGASRVTTNRCLQQLARRAVIRTEPGAVRVLAPEMLARAATDG
jgi:CRP/FNR family transcriptional regulator, cyclic AMP receptor protein